MRLKKQLLLALILLFLLFNLNAVDKKWEIEVHYSSWSINFLSSTLIGIIEDEIEDYDPEKGEVLFNSHGNNFGIGVRYFPAGKIGSFSVGFSHERNTMTIDLSGKYIKADSRGQQMVYEGAGQAIIRPHSFNLNVRWEMFPSYRIHPYFGIGFGIGVLVGEVEGYATSVTTLSNGESYTEVEYDEKDSLNDLINEYKDDGNSVPIGFFPFLQVQFGVRGEVARDTYLIAEVQFYSGISFKGGISYRF